jgi:hypothetical protein
VTKVLTALLTAGEPVDAACESSVAAVATALHEPGFFVSVALRLSIVAKILSQALVLAGWAFALPAPASTKTPAPASSKTPAPSKRPADRVSFPMSPPF